ncbi:hypothetical protein TNCV_4554991 [Trichonephila clavipes]|nr:hypothetical protein TNCV_4554991 [Trichonephila clavipes]
MDPEPRNIPLDKNDRTCLEAVTGSSRYRYSTHPPWLVTLTAVPQGLGSNPGDGMDVCKYVVPSRHGGTLNSRRASSPPVRLVKGEEAPVPHQGVLSQNRAVTCMVLKAKA